MPELNAMTVSLEGTHLIEAAAGTGKTYNIQTLVARLLLEKRIPIDKILVVTYTDLATGELRNRLHTILRNWLMENYRKRKRIFPDARHCCRQHNAAASIKVQSAACCAGHCLILMRQLFQPSTDSVSEC